MTDARHTGMIFTSERFHAARKAAQPDCMQDVGKDDEGPMADAGQWLLEALVPEADPLAMIANLRSRAGYRCADWPLDPQTQARNDRVAMVERLAADWAARNEGD